MTLQTREGQLEVAVVGATGAVGREMLSILEERDFPVAGLTPAASARSAGERLPFGDGEVEVRPVEEVAFEDVDLALFSAGSEVSRTHAPRAVDQGAVVVDNTSAFRLEEEVPLVVPKVNGDELASFDAPGIVANPNCSTIQMVAALEPLRRAAGLERVVVSTYQSASGAGQSGADELQSEIERWADRGELREEDAPGEVFAHPLASEALPHIGSFGENGFTSEEMKMVNETRKILAEPDLEVAARCVRIPSLRSHSESLTVDVERPIGEEEARAALEAADGVRVVDRPERAEYPLGRRASETDPTWVGRIRRDPDRPATLHAWVVADNLRKGAALNSIQIAERLWDVDSP
ncbi:MAG: aspartate-semialdehyde dehydrogenase [Bradymonadaceae bacterium]